jgi:hypothetical protein
MNSSRVLIEQKHSHLCIGINVHQQRQTHARDPSSKSPRDPWRQQPTCPCAAPPVVLRSTSSRNRSMSPQQRAWWRCALGRSNDIRTHVTLFDSMPTPPVLSLPRSVDNAPTHAARALRRAVHVRSVARPTSTTRCCQQQCAMYDCMHHFTRSGDCGVAEAPRTHSSSNAYKRALHVLVIPHQNMIFIANTLAIGFAQKTLLCAQKCLTCDNSSAVWCVLVCRRRSSDCVVAHIVRIARLGGMVNHACSALYTAMQRWVVMRSVVVLLAWR